MSNEEDLGVSVAKEKTDKRSDSSDIEKEKKGIGVTNYGFSEIEENRTDSNLVSWQVCHKCKPSLKIHD